MTTTSNGVLLRSAEPADVPFILALIGELSDYEHMRVHVVATEADIERSLFAPDARVFCEIAEHDGVPAAFALWHYNFSTFLGRPGLYLEDLFVRPAQRRMGIGRALLAKLAKRCVDENLGRLQWTVVDWNTNAIRFYEGLGAKLDHEWLGCRLQGDALKLLGTSSSD
ncbi:MAG: GNAT family N-acetyltransferase [Dokdonella sp.]